MTSPLYDEKLNSITPEAYFSISQYLKQAGIEEGPMNKKFRNIIYTCGLTLKTKQLSDKQIARIVSNMAYDKSHSLQVFSNDTLKNDYYSDYKIFQEVFELMELVNLN